METKTYRVNERIRAPQVRVIDPEGEQLGVMTSQEARAESERRSLDLIEVAPQASPPVCRIMDYGKFRYEQQKKAKEGRKKSKQVEIKDIRVRPNTDDHDLDFKLKNAAKFLTKGNKVKFTVIFRGPELRHKEIGERQLRLFIEGCKSVSVLDQAPRMEGRRMTMMLSPKAPVVSPDEPGGEAAAPAPAPAATPAPAAAATPAAAPAPLPAAPSQ